MFQLTGADDLCGAGPAPVTGTAFVAGANVAFGFTVALPSGRSAHASATISLSSLSGSWTDADGNTGPFLFNGPGGGSPRPPPSASTLITTTQFSPTIYGGTGGAATLARSDHDHDARYYTKAEVDTAKTTSAVVTGILGGPIGGSYTFVPEGSPAMPQTVTTDWPGRLLITKMFNGAPMCSPAAELLVFLIVDGVAVRSSALFFFGSTNISGRLSGVTEGVVPAGSHTIAVSGECLGAATLLGFSVAFISNTGVVVLP